MVYVCLVMLTAKPLFLLHMKKYMNHCFCFNGNGTINLLNKNYQVHYLHASYYSARSEKL